MAEKKWNDLLNERGENGSVFGCCWNSTLNRIDEHIRIVFRYPKCVCVFVCCLRMSMNIKQNGFSHSNDRQINVSNKLERLVYICVICQMRSHFEASFRLSLYKRHVLTNEQFHMCHDYIMEFIFQIIDVSLNWLRLLNFLSI